MQLLSIVHKINYFFDCNPTIDVGRVFLDTPKASENVLHEGILFKLTKYGINSKVLILPTNYLHEQYQRVQQNGQSSSWELIKSGVIKSRYLVPLFLYKWLLIFINDLPDNP